MIKRYDPMVLISPLRFRGFSLLVLRENICRPVGEATFPEHFKYQSRVGDPIKRYV